MNDTVRGLVLLCSVLLWLPFLRPTLDGSMPIEQSVLWYAGTLLLAWGGGAGLTALVGGYAEQTEQRAAEAQEAEEAEAQRTSELRRRAEDRVE